MMIIAELPIVSRLKLQLKSGLTPASVASSSPSLLDAIITPVGFHARKAAYLHGTATICHERYNDDIPRDLKEVLELPGIGPKMAYLIMENAWNQYVTQFSK